MASITRYLSRREVFIDGRSFSQLKLADLRERIAVVSQQATLFATSLRSNLAYGALHAATDAQLQTALEQANAAGFVAGLPQGLDSVLQEDGDDFSGGERQRLSLARAFLSDASVFVLDEATSAQDAESERLIQESLATLLENRTAIVVAHRLKTIESADRILVLDKGQIVEEGPHHELLEARGLYATLSKSLDSEHT